MAKSVLELAVGTGQWDAGLKKAKSALDNFTQANGGLQSALNKDSKSMQTFVQMMGRMDSTAKTAKGQMNDYKSTIEQLTMQYNRLTDAQKQTIGQDYLHSIDQMKQKYQGVADEVAKINQSLKQTQEIGTVASSGGGLFGSDKLGGMLQVFGGNLMTKAAGMGIGFASELGDMVKQSIELARQGEGIRIAFERLGRGDILDGLRQATHGTVSDIELMKAAVKFNDFRLPLEELGTMLAFAQQKAKDTGQSVDYMVDSIVTGLGRKSLMILDNLGLSAAQIKERMAETGDMTKAVGAIIREEMAKAGDYVETAADRATKANVEVQNAMERLGETFQPLTDSATSMWTDIKVGALDLLNNAVKPLIKALQEAGTLGQKARGNAGYENLGGDAKINRLIANLGDGKSPKAYRTYKAQMAEFDRYANSLKFKIASYGDDKSGVAQSAVAKLQTELAGVYTMRMEYERRAQELHKKATAKNIDENKEEEQSIDSLKKKLTELQEQRKKAIASGDDDLSKNLLKQINQVKADIKGLGGNTSTTTTHTKTTAEKIAWDANKTYLAATHATDNMPSVWGMLDEKGRKQLIGTGAKAFDLGKDITEKDLKKLLGKGTKEEKKDDKVMDSMTKLTSGVTGIFSGIEQMGIEIPDGMKQALNAINGLMSIAQSILVVVEAIKGLEAVGLIKLAGGGIVPHAAGGYMIGGNSYSGDNIYAGGAWVNSGELVLNRAQQSTLASQLQGQDKQMHVVGEVQGEKIILVANRTFRRKGQGEIVTW